MKTHSIQPVPSRSRLAAIAAYVCLQAVIVSAQIAPALPAPTSRTSPSAGSSTVNTPLAPAPKIIGAQNLMDRSYSPSWTAPSFPVADRQPKQFAVEYVYRYLQQDYKPAVALPQVTHSAAQQDTPEHTLIALITAVQTLDYEWWLSLWDARSREIFEKQAKEQKFDAAWWKARWQRAFQGKAVTLVTRLETVQDLILEVRIGPQNPGQPTPLMPFTFRFENGKWYATQELGDSGFLPWYGKDTISTNLDFVQDPIYSQRRQLPVVSKSQSLFFQNQTRGATSATEYVW